MYSQTYNVEAIRYITNSSIMIQVTATSYAMAREQVENTILPGWRVKRVYVP
jgi:hypothetical protein